MCVCVVKMVVHMAPLGIQIQIMKCININYELDPKGVDGMWNIPRNNHRSIGKLQNYRNGF